MSTESSEPALTAPSTAVPSATRATVHAGAHATVYLRAGQGEPVVLLCARPRRPLLATLAARFRVIAPELPRHALPPADGSPVPFSAWLRDFLDGLGVGRASVVAEERFALRTLNFALTDPTRVHRVALLFRDAPDPALSAGALPDLLGRAGHPLLVHREPDTGGRAAPRTAIAGDVLDFLTGREQPGHTVDTCGARAE